MRHLHGLFICWRNDVQRCGLVDCGTGGPCPSWSPVFDGCFTTASCIAGGGSVPKVTVCALFPDVLIKDISSKHGVTGSNLKAFCGTPTRERWLGVHALGP